MVGMNSNVNKILPHHRSCSSVTLVQTRFILNDTSSNDSTPVQFHRLSLHQRTSCSTSASQCSLYRRIDNTFIHL
uniref:Uncharacterized protein n=1 Tax=Nothobranchius pienaari TaxID=704102 RepID=A0A1A8MEL0_9TELE